MLLEVADLEKRFGGLVAIDGVSFRVAPGQIKAIIGPNGAGKTTLFNLLSGVLAPDRGTIALRGREITGWKAHAIAASGMARTFQIMRLFEGMTVLENVMVGCHLQTRTGMVVAALRPPSVSEEERRVAEAAWRVLQEIGLEERAGEQALSLPLGQQRMVEIARSLACRPALILLDEPGAGLSRRERQELVRLIRRIRDRGMTVLLVEHDMNLVMDISDEVMVLDYGRKIAEGPPRQVQNDERVIAAYLGEEVVPGTAPGEN